MSKGKLGSWWENYILCFIYMYCSNFINYHYCYINHKQLPSQKSKPRLHLSYFQSVLLHLCRHHVLAVVLQTISFIFEKLWWHFSILWALSNQKWCLFKRGYVVWCLFSLWSCKFDLGLLSVSMCFRLLAQICFTIEWGIVTVRFGIAIVLSQSLLYMLCQLSAMNYFFLHHPPF